MAAAWQHPGRASLKRYSSLLSVQAGHSNLPVSTDTHKGLKFNSPGVQSFSENPRTHGQKKKTPIVNHMKSKPYRLSGITEKEDIKCHRPFFFELEKNKISSPTKKKKKKTSQIVVNGYVLCLIFDSQLEILKTKNKKGVLPPPQSHTLSIFSSEVKAGPEINTFITDNRHLIKKEHCQ